MADWDKYDHIRFAENEFSVSRAVGSIREQKRTEAVERRSLNRDRYWVSLDTVETEAAAHYEPHAPCPSCFESSGYVWEHGTDRETGPWSHQTNIPCSYCNGTGLVPCDEPTAPDDREDDFAEPEYELALDAQSLKCA
jgi:hypothetical protein